MKTQNQSTSIISALQKLIVSTCVTAFTVFHGCQSTQTPPSKLLKDSSITIFPAVVRTQDGTTYDSNVANSITAMLEQMTNVDVMISADEIGMADTAEKNSFQYGIFQSSLKRFSEFIHKKNINTEYALLTDYLISKTPDGGYAAGGIHCYVVNQNGEKQYLLLLNSHHELFQEGNLKTNEQTLKGLQTIVDRCTGVVIKAIQLDG